MDVTTFTILGFLAVLTVVIITRMRRMRAEDKGVQEEVKYCKTTGGVCCGGGGEHCHHKQSAEQHFTYYEDEELDHYRGRAADSYSEGEIAEWREVYATLRSEEVSGWLKSIQERGLQLPASIEKEISVREN